MAETGTTQFAQGNALLFVRKKIRWGKQISTLSPSQTPPPPASPLKAAYFNIYHLGLILESRDFHLFVDSLSESWFLSPLITHS